MSRSRALGCRRAGGLPAAFARWHKAEMQPAAAFIVVECTTGRIGPGLIWLVPARGGERSRRQAARGGGTSGARLWT